MISTRNTSSSPSTSMSTSASASVHHSAKTNTNINTNKLLKQCYIATTSLCLFMVIWILLFPSSTYYKHYITKSTTYDQIHAKFSANEHNYLPQHLIRKYDTHTAIHLTHILPAVLWSVIIPFQLHPSFRNSYRTLHRLFGYIFFCICVIMMIGVIIIMKRELLSEYFMYSNDNKHEHEHEHEHDRNDTHTHTHSSMDTHSNNNNSSESNNDTWLWIPTKQNELFLLSISCWFIYTAMRAIKHAKQRQYYDHQKWFLRHIASGIWVAIQRVIIIIVIGLLDSFRSLYVYYYYYVYSNVNADTDENENENIDVPQRLNLQPHLFNNAALVGMVLSVIMSELCILQLEKRRTTTMTTTTKKMKQR